MKKILTGFTIFVLLLISNASAATITIAGDNQVVNNCYPFGGGNNGWLNYMGFVYKDVPAFNLKPGDTLAFDLGTMNDTDIQLQVDIVQTISNGSDVEAGTYTTIVSNNNKPLNPRGDTVVGNFELKFTAEQSFNFPGGGLIIRFSNPAGAFASDSSCEQVLVNSSASDTSGFFVERFFRDPDGVSPYSYSATDSIGAFQVITNSPVSVPLSNSAKALLAILFAFGAFFMMNRRKIA